MRPRSRPLPARAAASKRRRSSPRLRISIWPIRSRAPRRSWRSAPAWRPGRCCRQRSEMMKVIGLIGGMSCESTAHYYARLNQRVRGVLGGLHSAEILMWSVDFAAVAEMQSEGRWQEAGANLAAIARRLEGAGADVIVLATNTMHKVADAI